MTVSSGIIDPTLVSSYEVYNGLAPLKAPRAMLLNFDFSIAASFSFDLQLAQSLDKLEFIQSIYVDNADNSSSVIFTFGISNQRVIIPSNSQGYVSVLCPNAPRFTVACDNAVVIPVHLLSFPVAQMIWTA